MDTTKLIRNFPIRIYPGGTGGKMICNRFYIWKNDYLGYGKADLNKIQVKVYMPIFRQLYESYGEMLYGYLMP